MNSPIRRIAQIAASVCVFSGFAFSANDAIVAPGNPTLKQAQAIINQRIPTAEARQAFYMAQGQNADGSWKWSTMDAQARLRALEGYDPSKVAKPPRPMLLDAAPQQEARKSSWSVKSKWNPLSYFDDDEADSYYQDLYSSRSLIHRDNPNDGIVRIRMLGGTSSIKYGDKREFGWGGKTEISVPFGRSSFEFNARGYYNSMDFEMGTSDVEYQSYGGSGTIVYHASGFGGQGSSFSLRPFLGAGVEAYGYEVTTKTKYSNGGYALYGGRYAYMLQRYASLYASQAREYSRTTETKYDDDDVTAIVRMGYDINWGHAFTRMEVEYLPDMNSGSGGGQGQAANGMSDSSYGLDLALMLGYDLTEHICFDLYGSYGIESENFALFAGLSVAFGGADDGF